MTEECQSVRERLLDYLHGEVDEAEATSITRHLASCHRCALAYCRWRADVEGIIDAHVEAPRPEVRVALRRRVELEFAPSRWQRLVRWWRRPIPAYRAAVATLLPVVAWLVTVGTGLFERDHADEVADPATPPALISDYDAMTVLNPYRGVFF